ncbi:MAG TPA: hypothetical protein VEU08_09990, partial [Vicinamibacterales bacterium]|nr:hypothetical protein [Vicinamibacterales bacterium]
MQTDDATVAGTFLADGRLEVVAGANLLRYDLAADGRLTLLSLVPVPGINMLTSSGSLLAGAGADGVTVWQTNGASLDRVAQYSVRGAISGIALHGSILYVAVENVAVFVFDTTAASAEPLATISENALALAFSGDVLWLATGVTGLVAVDVSDSAAPRILSRTGAGAVVLARIAVSGTLVFASELPDTLHVYDAADPEKPTETATIRDAAQVVAASRGKLFLAGATFDRFGIETETGTPLRVYDASDVHAPKLAGVWEDLAGPVRGVATDGSLAYVVDPPRFRIIDVSRSDAPREIASMAIDAGLDRVKLRGSDVILYGRGDVLRIDVHDPYNPKTKGVFHSLGRPPSNAAFARDTIIEGNPWSGLHVVDFDSFAEPGQISGVKGHYYEIVALPDTIYGFELTTMRAIDLTNRNNAVPVRDVGIGVLEAAILAAQEPPLLVVHAVDRLRIFKLADRLNPIETSSLDVPVDGLLSTDGDAAFFASGGSVFHLDLGDP